MWIDRSTKTRAVEPFRRRSRAITAYFTQQYARGTLDDLAGRHVGLASAYADQPWAIPLTFYVHVVSAGLALLIGPWQFAVRLRNRHRRAHRAVGRVYLVSVAIGAVSGLATSFVNSVGLLGFFGFAPLSLIWGWTAWRAYRSARARDFRAHQAWAVRNFALTYAAVTLRLWFGLLILVQLPFAAPGSVEQVLAEAYAPVAYLAWIPNLVVAELFLRARGLPALRLST